MTVREIAERTSLSEDKVLNVLQDLSRVYDMMNSAIRIAKIGNDYAMALREEYAHYTENFTSGELTKGMMKTLATIAYNQPILQSELFRNIGARVYEDVPVLIEMGLVHAKKVGQTVAERAKAKGVDEVVFDRGGYVYTGRVQALAEGAREGGLQF